MAAENGNGHRTDLEVMRVTLALGREENGDFDSIWKDTLSFIEHRKVRNHAEDVERAQTVNAHLNQLDPLPAGQSPTLALHPG